MDNQSYLDQIAVKGKNSINSEPLLSPVMMKLLIAGVIALITIIIVGIMVSNPIRQEDVLPLQQKVDEINRNLAETVGKGKTRNEKNSGCSKIFNAVKYHLGSQSNQYVNKIEDGQFVVSIQINLAPIKK